jgi:hypothetical protein
MAVSSPMCLSVAFTVFSALFTVSEPYILMSYIRGKGEIFMFSNTYDNGDETCSRHRQ